MTRTFIIERNADLGPERLLFKKPEANFKNKKTKHNNSGGSSPWITRFWERKQNVSKPDD